MWTPAGDHDVPFMRRLATFDGLVPIEGVAHKMSGRRAAIRIHVVVLFEVAHDEVGGTSLEELDADGNGDGDELFAKVSVVSRDCAGDVTHWSSPRVDVWIQGWDRLERLSDWCGEECLKSGPRFRDSERSYMLTVGSAF